MFLNLSTALCLHQFRNQSRFSLFLYAVAEAAPPLGMCLIPDARTQENTVREERIATTSPGKPAAYGRFIVWYVCVAIPSFTRTPFGPEQHPPTPQNRKVLSSPVIHNHTHPFWTQDNSHPNLNFQVLFCYWTSSRQRKRAYRRTYTCRITHFIQQ